MGSIINNTIVSGPKTKRMKQTVRLNTRRDVPIACRVALRDLHKACAAAVELFKQTAAALAI